MYSLLDRNIDSTRTPYVRSKAREAVRRAMERDEAKRRAIPPAVKPSVKDDAKKSPMVAAKGDDDLMSQPQQR